MVQKKTVSKWKDGQLAADERAWDEKGKPVAARNMAQSPYELGFQQGEEMGKGERDLIDSKLQELAGNGQSVTPTLQEVIMGRAKGFRRRALNDLLEAKRLGGRPEILEHAQGYYEGLNAGLGPYAK